MMKFLAILLACLVHVQADIYMHNPRGSNNRLDEDGRERRNANRLFDSQNNNRGGYNVGSLYYFQGSKLGVEWTNQHSCNNPNSHCEIVIQYMCGQNVRDGASTTTIPDNIMACENYDCNTDTQYGMHEDYDYYLNCKLRERNKGLFIADQNLNNRNKAKNTRQNPNGNRRGYECPEERDYYPYWHPTPWVDVAILTNDATRCPYYQSESANVKERWECVIPRTTLIQSEHHGLVIPNNKEDCDGFRWPTNDESGIRGEWTKTKPRGTAPECRETEFSRDNHLGNGIGGYPLLYNWTIPDVKDENCALRIRYNISTEDYDPWNTTAAQNKPSGSNAAAIPFAERFGFDTETEAEERGWKFKGNPEVQLFEEIPNFDLRLAINTAQYGRTFQDRSHTFAIRKPTGELKGATIHNLNVRGKRGNIVQVYPAVEYDFIPNTLQTSVNDFVHIQWTGSNTNPHNNDGQGRAGSDRSNMVLQRVQAYDEGSGAAYTPGEKYGHWGRSYPEQVHNSTLIGLTSEDMMSLALLSPVMKGTKVKMTGQFRGEMSELDDAGTYFDLGPRKVTRTGVFHYLCTRNNNFSNRSQKGRIICGNTIKERASIGWNGGNVSTSGSAVEVEQGVFEQLWKLEMEEWTPEQGENVIAEKNREFQIGDGYASNFVVLSPEQPLTAENKEFTMKLNVESPGVDEIAIYKSNSQNFATWARVKSVDIQNNEASFAAQEGGVYIAVRHKNVGLIAGIVVGILIVIGLIAGVVFYRYRNPQAFHAFTRSFTSKV